MRGNGQHKCLTVVLLSQACLLIILLMIERPLTAVSLTPRTERTVCDSGCDFSTIQGAINAANNGDVIQLLFTSPHTENDIVVNKNITIEGLGGANTIVQADANPNTAANRVFFIPTGFEVQLEDFTIRHGKVNSTGGGIYNDGSSLTLTNINIRYNQAPAGAGLYNAGGEVTMTNGQVSFNMSSDTGGGVYNTGDLFINNVYIQSNQTTRKGGGIYNTGQAVIRGSTIGFNQVSGFSTDSTGGGIYNESTLLLIDSVVEYNILTSLGIPTSSGGGGIYSANGEATLVHSTVQGNQIGDLLLGAGLALHNNETTINQSLISANKGLGGISRGGGIYMADGSLTINQTTIRDNVGGGGGGLHYALGDVTINGSLFQGNKSNFGGGLYICGDQDAVVLSNVTVSGNEATADGGGIFVCDTAFVSLASVTMSGNQADSDHDDDGDGGGIYLYTFNANSATARIKNSLIAGNTDSTVFPTIRAHDCFGELTSMGYNLIGTLGFKLVGEPCSLSGNSTGNLVSVMPKLNPLTDNGGPTLTHALQPDSPAVNGADPVGCTDFDNVPLLEDQRGGLRIDRCDIGAFELNALVEKVNLPFLIRP